MASEATKLISRFLISYTFGSLPFITNLLVNMIAGTLTFYSVFHVADLMHLTLTICGATLFDLIVDSPDHEARFAVIMIYTLILLAIIAALLLGLSAYYVAEPPASGPYATQMHRLITFGLYLSTSAFLIGVVAEIWLCFRKSMFLAS